MTHKGVKETRTNQTLFALRETLLRSDPWSQSLLFEKIDALHKIKLSANLQVFKFAIEPLLDKEKFTKELNDPLV